jgi:S1-C subfamily serine protease
MAVPSSSTLSRVCPACARRVAPPAMTCRCGKPVDGVPLTAAPARPLPAPPPDTTRLENVAKVAVVFVAILILGYMIFQSSLVQSHAPKPVATAFKATPAAAGTAAPPRAIPRSAPQTEPPSSSANADTPAGAAPTGPELSPLERVMAAAAASRPAEAGSATPTAPATLAAPSNLEDLISRAMPAVVRVETPGGFGSGFFIAPDTLLTNVHVVGTNTTVSVRRRDGTTVTARVDSTAPDVDVAVIRISSPDPNQPVLAMGSGVHARAGQEVVALGTPLGLQNTVTRGIVSAVREIGGLTLLQTDAAISPGNSGGPLLDRAGLVIGITSLGVKSAEAQGLGFAIAIEHAQALLSGKRATDARGTLLSTVNEAMSGQKAPPAGDGSRDRAAKAYEQAIGEQARRADALDQDWRGFKRICYQGQIVGTFDREWFALWDTHAMPGLVPPGCANALDTIRRTADAIRDAMVAAGEAARQADVYPGTRRDLLQRSRLNSPAWNR